MKHIRKTFFALFAGLLIIFASACSLGYDSIAELKNDEHVGEKVRIRGEVTSALKLGGVSGFRIRDESNETITVSSESLPAEGEVVAIEGTLVKDSLFGYYIRRDE